MNREHETREDALVDLGAASVETKGTGPGIPESQGKVLAGGISAD